MGCKVYIQKSLFKKAKLNFEMPLISLSQKHGYAE